MYVWPLAVDVVGCSSDDRTAAEPCKIKYVTTPLHRAHPDLCRITRGFHSVLATGLICQEGRLTPPTPDSIPFLRNFHML